MTTVNRVLTVLVFAATGVLVWALVSHTDWAATRSLIGVGNGYEHPLTPLVEIAGTVIIAVAVKKLVQSSTRWFSERGLGRNPRSRVPGARPSDGTPP